MRVILSWPHSGLSPNARLHWAKRAKLIKLARAEAAALTYDVMSLGLREIRLHFRSMETIPLTVRFVPPDNRRRDRDNMVACCKAFMDGVSDALGVNDAKFRPQYQFADPCKPGRVEVELG